MSKSSVAKMRSVAKAPSNYDKIYVRVISGRNLLDMDIGGTSDPYTLVGFRDRGNQLKTKTIMKNLNPTWNEEFCLEVENPEFDVLEITVMDYDHLKSDDFIGKLVIPVLQLRAHREECVQWYDLKDKKLRTGPNKRGKLRGEVQLGIRYSAVNAAPNQGSSGGGAGGAGGSSGSSGSGMMQPRWQIKFSELQLDVELGRGAFGVVYKGKWRLQDVAVKKLLDSLTDKELEEFKLEAALMMGLRPHRNVVQMLGICADPGQPLAIVTAFYDAGSLHSLLMKREVQLSWPVVVKILQGVCAGMFHLHQEQILHRDLAARNILIDQTYEPRVADFGLSKRVDIKDFEEHKRQATTNMLQSNESGYFRGPYKFMAPESLKSNEFSIKSDVWSFGVVVWEVVTRAPEPFPELDIYQAADQISNHGLRLHLPPYSPPLFTQLVDWCFQGNPDQRPDFAQVSNHLGIIAQEVHMY
eukprot:CAMPEP_0177666264 /NCGR_PEP_ID=MMETSP0447-20121125/21490_1 /TAXON_ID=0 /ORGANISM="Stygamoeba regulata, Strain BSH-02190019" /LENGTH=468 /DNA_ID=CAMNT_0019172403 /DNA_START=12 /DNA_END=1419 /DNA_ORIENTATION=+